MATVKLRNGAEAETSLVAIIMPKLREMWDRDPVDIDTIYALKKICLGKSDEVYSAAIEKLKSLGLIESSGQMGDSIRNIVIPSLEGEGFQTRLVFPVARPDAPNDGIPNPEKNKG